MQNAADEWSCATPMTTFRVTITETSPELSKGGVAGLSMRTAPVATGRAEQGDAEAINQSLQYWWQGLEEGSDGCEQFAAALRQSCAARSDDQALAELTPDSESIRAESQGLLALGRQIEKRCPNRGTELGTFAGLAAEQKCKLQRRAGGTMSRVGTIEIGTIEIGIIVSAVWGDRGCQLDPRIYRAIKHDMAPREERVSQDASLNLESRESNAIDARKEVVHQERRPSLAKVEAALQRGVASGKTVRNGAKALEGTFKQTLVNEDCFYRREIWLQREAKDQLQNTGIFSAEDETKLAKKRLKAFATNDRTILLPLNQADILHSDVLKKEKLQKQLLDKAKRTEVQKKDRGPGKVIKTEARSGLDRLVSNWTIESESASRVYAAALTHRTTPLWSSP